MAIVRMSDVNIRVEQKQNGGENIKICIDRRFALRYIIIKTAVNKDIIDLTASLGEKV